jgi:putative redox protein
MKMSTIIKATYKGNLDCEAVHKPSGSKIVTTAPPDNHGKGDKFSPTDLVATALATCYLTIMGISAEGHKINMKGTTATVEKFMSEDKPRRIARLVIKVNFCKGIPFNHRGLLEAVAINCPTTKSLHPDLKIEYEFNFPD